MKINWKRVLIAAFWSELVVFVLYIAAQYVGSTRGVIVALVLFMFLAGFWVAREIESRFVLHGLMVGIVANVLYFALDLVVSLVRPMIIPSEPVTGLVASSGLKILAAAAGAYVGGRRHKKPQSQPAGSNGPVVSH